jgi:tetratricopeptide (TPR) repeat protein
MAAIAKVASTCRAGVDVRTSVVGCPASETCFSANIRLLGCAALLIVFLYSTVFSAAVVPKALDEMSLDRWAKLRELERFQLQTAEKYYREQNWTVAAAEYEKYLQLYERSEGAPYAQLKWSLCQVRLHKANTAIKDGFQSVIDYWPDAPDAVLAAYYMGDTYKGMGQTAKAKRALAEMVEKHPQHPAAVRAITVLLEIAESENDRPAQAALWKRLALEVPRTRENRRICAQAAGNLASYLFSQAALKEGIQALSSNYSDDELPARVLEYLRGPLAALAEQSASRSKADKLLELAVVWFHERIPRQPATAEQKAAARDLWLAIADLQAAARADARVAETYEQISKFFGADDTVLGRMAVWYESIGRDDDAHRTYRRFADKSAGLAQLASSHRRRKQCDGAVAVYRELASVDPQRAIHWQGEIGGTYCENKQYQEAVATYRELLEQDVAHADQWRWKLASSYMAARSFKEAIVQFRQCERFPANYREMAACQRHLKQFDEAIMLYHQIIGGDPKSAPLAMLEIAQTLEQAGRTEKAIKAFQDVCRLYPRDPCASKAHAHLQSKYKISVTLGGDIQK